MNKKQPKLNIDKILNSYSTGPNRWELDNIVWYDRSTNPKTMYEFLSRIKELQLKSKCSKEELRELEILQDLSEDLNEEDCINLLSDDEELCRETFIEGLARKSALEVLTNERVSYDTMNLMCKLSPTDFILTSKRTQDLINSIHELVIQGETLSKDVAGA